MDIQNQIVDILLEINEDPIREGLKDTPRRVESMYNEFFDRGEEPKMTKFNAEGMDQMIIVKDIQFYSFCEHHIIPFFGTAHVAYVPNKHVLGISKIPRVVEYCARSLTNQERLTQDIARKIYLAVDPIGVGVVLEARHLCMEMRGIKKQGAFTVTSDLIGCFREIEARAEFMNLIK